MRASGAGDRAIDALLRNRTSFTDRIYARILDGRCGTMPRWIGLWRVLKDERCLIAGERSGLRNYTNREVLSEQAARHGAVRGEGGF